MFNNIGPAIKELRLKHGFTQQELANNTDYTRDFISKIELGKRQAPPDLLVSLSKLLQLDLITLDKHLNKYENLAHYLAANRLITCVEKQDLYQIKTLLETDSIYNDFNYGEPMLIKNYCNSLVLFYITKNYDECLTLTLSTLNLNLDNIENYTIKISSNYYYSTLLILAGLIREKNEFTVLFEFEKKIIDFIEQYYFNNVFTLPSIDYYFKKLYTLLLNNHADTCFSLLHFNNALTVCEKGIDSCYKLNILNSLPLLLKLKVEILYNLDQVIQAKEAFIDFKSICNITKIPSYFENVTNNFKNDYPLLFNQPI